MKTITCDKAYTTASFIFPAFIEAVLCAAYAAEYMVKTCTKNCKKAARAAATKVFYSKWVKPSLNSAEKKAELTAYYKAKTKTNNEIKTIMASTGLSEAKILARKEQSEAQKLANEIRKIERSMQIKPSTKKGIKGLIKSSGIKTIPAKLKGIKDKEIKPVVNGDKAKIANVRGEFKTFAEVAKEKAKQDLVNKAKARALRESRIQARKDKINRIAGNIFDISGIWVTEDVVRACNDWDYHVREEGYKELKAIAFVMGVAA